MGTVGLWVFLELSAWRARRRRAAAAAAVPVLGPRLSLPAERGCSCSLCIRERRDARRLAAV